MDNSLNNKQINLESGGECDLVFNLNFGFIIIFLTTAEVNKGKKTSKLRNVGGFIVNILKARPNKTSNEAKSALKTNKKGFFSFFPRLLSYKLKLYKYLFKLD